MAVSQHSTDVRKARRLAEGSFTLFDNLSERISALPARDLRNLGEATRCVVDTLCGLSCQPKFGGMDRTMAGDIVDGFVNAFNAIADLIAAVAEAGVGSDADVEDRAWTVLAHKAELADCLGGFAELAARLAAEMGSVRQGRKAVARG